MQIKVKLPFDKFSRSDVGHAIQVMALECRVVEFYNPQEALIEFEESYLNSLEGENKTKYLALLVDYTESEVIITGPAGEDSGKVSSYNDWLNYVRTGKPITMPTKVTALPDGGYLIEPDETIGQMWEKDIAIQMARFERDIRRAQEDFERSKSRNGKPTLQEQLHEAYEISRCTDYQLIDAANFYREKGCPMVAEDLEKQYYNIKRWLESYNKGR